MTAPTLAHERLPRRARPPPLASRPPPPLPRPPRQAADGPARRRHRRVGRRRRRHLDRRRPAGPAGARSSRARFGARQVGPDGTGGYVVARAPGARVRGALRSAACSSTRSRTRSPSRWPGVPDDPLSATRRTPGARSSPTRPWRRRRSPPTSPLIALVDAQLDETPPGVRGSNTTTTSRLPGDRPRTAPRPRRSRPRRRTASASSASGPARARSTCRCRTRSPARPRRTQIAKAIQQRRRRDQHELRLARPLLPEYVALQFAVARGIVPVAAAGNEFAEGNPLEFPASLPHVLTVAARRARPQELVLLEHQRGDRPLGARARRS